MVLLLHIFVVLGSGCSTSINSNPLWAPAMPDSLVEESPLIDPNELALSIHQNTNMIRQSEGLPKLSWNDEISLIAKSHSKDMAVNGYFSHINKKGESATERASRLGFSGIHTNPQYVVVGIGENLFATPSIRGVCGYTRLTRSASILCKVEGYERHR